jgi:hypothetical protein
VLTPECWLCSGKQRHLLTLSLSLQKMNSSDFPKHNEGTSMYVSVQPGTMNGPFMCKWFKLLPLDHAGGILFCECATNCSLQLLVLSLSAWGGKAIMAAVAKHLYQTVHQVQHATGNN